MMRTDEFLTFLNEELGLDLQSSDLERGLDEVAGWDSVLMLRMKLVLDRHYACKVPLPKLLAAERLSAVLALLPSR